MPQMAPISYSSMMMMMIVGATIHIGSSGWSVLEHFFQDLNGTLQYTMGGNVVSIALARDYYPDLTQVLIHSWVDWYPTSNHDTDSTATSEIWTATFRTTALCSNHSAIRTTGLDDYYYLSFFL